VRFAVFFRTIIINPYKYTNMKKLIKLIDVLTDEDKYLDMPWWMYAIVIPFVLVALIGIAGWMDMPR